MVKYLTPTQLETVIPKITEDLITMKGKNKEKVIANKYKVDLSFVMHIAKTRKTGLASKVEEDNVSSDTVVDTINNADVVKDQTEKEADEIKDEKEIIVKNEKGVLTEEAKIAIAIDYDNGTSLSRIAKKYDISISTVNRIVNQLGCERKGRAPIIFDTEEKINKALDMYFKDGKTQKEIADFFGCSGATVSNMIKEKGNKINMRKKGTRKNSKKLNNHQVEKLRREQQKKYEEVENTTTIENNGGDSIHIEETKSNEPNEIQNSIIKETYNGNLPIISFANKIFEDKNFIPLSNTVAAGMVSDRHNMGNLQYIFNGPIT